MASKTMHHVVIGSDTYEIVDEQGRANVATNTQDISALKEDYDDIDNRVTALEGGGSGSGLTEGIKAALLQIASKVAYIDEHGQDYYDGLYDALYPPADLVSISAVYTQSGTVYDTDTLDSLKDDLVVTAHYSDQTTETVTTYTLSGTLTEGTSTVTVAYSGKTTTFNVTVTEEQSNLIFTEPLTMVATNTQFSWDSETQTGSGNGALSWGSLVAQNLLYKFSDVSDKRIRISYTLTLSDLVEGHAGTGSFIDIGLYTSATPANASSTNRKANYGTTKYVENGTYTINETYDLSTIFTGSGLDNYYLGIAWFMNLANQGTGAGTAHGTISNVRAEVI